MGRFYKTASPQMVDFMYKIPEQAILKAIEGTDKQIDTEYLYKTETEKLLQKKALSPDEARQKEKLAGYQKEIDEVSQLLSTSPLAALKDKQRIRDLQSKIYQDVTRGEIAAQYKNYDIRQKYLEEETKRATDANGAINMVQLNEAMDRWDKNFAKGDVDDKGQLLKGPGTAYDPTTGAYRTYATEKLVNYFDATKEAKSQAEGWEPDVDTDITKQYLDQSGNYLITDRQGRVELDKNKLAFGLYDIILTNPESKTFYDQGIRIRSGAKPGTEEYLKEWEKLYGVRKQRGNLGSPFAMETVMQTITDPETGKTETKPLTQKVQKYDENGKPVMENGKPVTEDKEVKRVVNAGEIFNIAEAAAERKDKEKIVSSVTREATEGYKTALQQQKEIAVANAKHNLENPVITMDIVNNEIVTQTLPGSTPIEIEKNIQKSKEGLTQMKDDLKQSYLTTIATTIKVNPKLLGSNAKDQLSTKEKLDNFVKSGDYNGLELYLKQQGIELPGVSEAVRNINSSQLAIDNNERIFNAKVENIKDSKEYMELKRKLEVKYYSSDTDEVLTPIQKAILIDNELGKLVREKFKNETTQVVKTIEGQQLQKQGIISEQDERKLSDGLKYVKNNPLSILGSIGAGTNAVINKVSKDGKVTQSFTTFADLLASYNIPLTSGTQIEDSEGNVEITYAVPGSKDKLAVKINRASLIEGNATNLKIQTAAGKSEQVNLGLLPLNINMEVLKIKEDGKKEPESVNIMMSRNNVRVSAIEDVVNKKGVLSTTHVASQSNRAKSDYQGLGSGVKNYTTDEYGVMYYPNEAQGTATGKVVLPTGTAAFGEDGIKLWQNYIYNSK